MPIQRSACGARYAVAVIALVATACDKSPTAPRNAAPTVSVAFDGPSSCTPQPGVPCKLSVFVVASDPDGDPVRYRWSGCASGDTARATCTVDRAGPVTASVEVSDNHGHAVTAALSGEGISRPNTPPNVVVTFQGPSECTPLPGTPCTLDVLAEAVDPDGDPLHYAWSGCASGTSARATCVVAQPGPVTASVEVSDGHNAPGRALAVGQGSNRSPDVEIGYVTLFPSGAIEILGNVKDPDEGFICGRHYCGVATASGACANARLECTCLAGLEASVTRTIPSGTCTVTFSLKDSWELIGTPSINFDVSNPKVWWRTPSH